MHNTYRILKQIKNILNLTGLSTHAPISQNSCFKPSMMDAAVPHWFDKGLTTIRDLYIYNDFFCRVAGEIWSPL